mmetsp:Transcript_38740/g.107627  ORF Transcript_38740/g.107627 Transcript_38740/m.107627 type:complete len:131 (-) Transcript_38740:282-674(-)
MGGARARERGCRGLHTLTATASTSKGAAPPTGARKRGVEPGNGALAARPTGARQTGQAAVRRCEHHASMQRGWKTWLHCRTRSWAPGRKASRQTTQLPSPEARGRRREAGMAGCSPSQRRPSGSAVVALT